MTLKDSHTRIPAHQTVGEIIGLLAKAGARQVQVTYDASGLPDGLAFELATPNGPRAYRLPVSAEPVKKRLSADYAAGRLARTQSTPEHARAVGWRILKDWVAAQLAILESGMVSADEVLLPWMELAEGKTVYEAYHENVLKLPAAGEASR